MIWDIKVKELQTIPDDRGRVMEILRCDDLIFKKFGQVYITTTLPGVVKAWHLHKKQTDNIVCVQGMIKLVVYDLEQKEFLEFYIGVHNPLLVQVPPGLYHGWKCISTEEAIIVGMPTEPYNSKDPDEFRRPAHGDLDYDWNRRDR